MRAALQPDETLQQVRAITLDLDDTLWAIEPVIRRAELALWDWLSLHYPEIPSRFSENDVRRLRDDVVEELIDQSHDLRLLRKSVLRRLAMESGYDDSLVEPAFSVFDAARNAVELFPDVVPQLTALGERFSIVAVTNGNANLETIGIRHLFHDVVTAVDAGAAKPDPRIFHVAIQKAGVAAECILHVGDHPETDVDGARKAGLATAWMNRHGAEWPDHLERPDATVTSLMELRRLLDHTRASDG